MQSIDSPFRRPLGRRGRDPAAHRTISRGRFHRITSYNVCYTKLLREFLFIKSEYKLVRINLKEVLYIEGMKEYVRIHLQGQKPVMTLLSMKSLEEELPQSSFMRVHRSFIVNIEKVSVVERFRIIFNNDVYIPVSDNYKDKFQEFLNKNFMG